MHELFSWISDSNLTALAYIVNVVLGALGFEFTLRPVEKGKRLRFTLFLLIVLIGCASTWEQSKRTQEDNRRAQEGSVKMDAINGVIQTMASGIKSEIISQAAMQAQAIVNGNSKLIEQVGARQPRTAIADKPSLLNRSLTLDRKLQGLQADWRSKLEKEEAEIRARQVDAEYVNASESKKAMLRESDAEELRWWRSGINKSETQYYQNTYQAEAEILRAELIPLAPGVGDVRVNYRDDDPGQPTYGSFERIADDFHLLVSIYAKAPQPSR